MEWHTHNDLSAGDPIPRFLGDRLKYGERVADEVHLADEWRYHQGRDYTYGLSNPRLRPTVLDEAEQPEHIVLSEQAQREEYIKAKRARDLAAKKAEKHRLRTQVTYREPKPLIPIVTEVRVQHVAPEPEPAPPQYIGKYGRPMGLTGDVLTALLDE